MLLPCFMTDVIVMFKADVIASNKNQKPYLVVPYHKGVSESLKKICDKHGVQVYFKGGNTIKSLLVAPKDQDPILKKSGVIYRYKCGRVDCNEEYIGQSSRTFGERFREHQKAPPQSMTIATSVVIKSLLIISILLGGRTRTSVEHLKKHYI